MFHKTWLKTWGLKIPFNGQPTQSVKKKKHGYGSIEQDKGFHLHTGRGTIISWLVYSVSTKKIPKNIRVFHRSISRLRSQKNQCEEYSTGDLTLTDLHEPEFITASTTHQFSHTTKPQKTSNPQNIKAKLNYGSKASSFTAVLQILPISQIVPKTYSFLVAMTSKTQQSSWRGYKHAQPLPKYTNKILPGLWLRIGHHQSDGTLCPSQDIERIHRFGTDTKNTAEALRRMNYGDTLTGKETSSFKPRLLSLIRSTGLR